MKIKSVTKTNDDLIEVEDSEFSTYRRINSDNYEVLIGCSFEQIGNCEEVEKLYQQYMKENHLYINIPNDVFDYVLKSVIYLEETNSMNQDIKDRLIRNGNRLIDKYNN